MKTLNALIASLLLLAPAVVIAGGKIAAPNKHVVISEKQAASLTNRIERILHEIRIPEVEFRQAAIVDIISFLNQASKDNAKTEEAKQITIELAPATEKELMRFEKWEGGGSIVGVYTFNGLDLSVLEAVQLLQIRAQLDRKVEGQKLILSMKKYEN